MLIKNGWGGERIAQLTGRKEDESGEEERQNAASELQTTLIMHKMLPSVFSPG
jgi:hypothetical protein